MSISYVLNPSISQETKLQKSDLGKIGDLPELVHKVFSYLAAKELEIVVCVNKKFCEHRLETIRFYTPRLQKEFIGSCVFRLIDKGYDVLAGKLEAIKDRIDDRDCRVLSLKEIALYISYVMRTLSNVLKDIPIEENVNQILPRNKPWHMRNLDCSIILERQIDETNRIDDEEKKSDEQCMLAKSLAYSGLFNRAIEYVNTTMNPRDRESTLKIIYMIMARAGRV